MGRGERLQNANLHSGLELKHGIPHPTIQKNIICNEGSIGRMQNWPHVPPESKLVSKYFHPSTKAQDGILFFMVVFNYFMLDVQIAKPEQREKSAWQEFEWLLRPPTIAFFFSMIGAKVLKYAKLIKNHLFSVGNRYWWHRDFLLRIRPGGAGGVHFLYRLH